jgi:hypothetical protein
MKRNTTKQMQHHQLDATPPIKYNTTNQCVVFLFTPQPQSSPTDP